MPELKSCKHCNTMKPIHEFKKDSRVKSGYSSICKECAHATNKEYRDTHKEQRNAYLSEYREVNRVGIQEYSHIYYTKYILIRKRCPKCKKHFTFHKYRGIATPIFKCDHCGTALRRSKTLSSNPTHDNANGFRIKMVEA